MILPAEDKLSPLELDDEDEESKEPAVRSQSNPCGGAYTTAGLGAGSSSEALRRVGGIGAMVTCSLSCEREFERRMGPRSSGRDPVGRISRMDEVDERASSSSSSSSLAEALPPGDDWC